MDKIIVAGKSLVLSPMDKAQTKGVSIDTSLRYDLFHTEFNDNPFCLLIRKERDKSAPLHYKKLSDKLEQILGLPIVFLFDSLEYYERNRLIERGVYFIVSNKYTFLPYLIINAKESTRKNTDSLTAAAQYLLLYHLQAGSLTGLTIKDIERKVPYKYVTLTRAVACLENLNLCRSEKGTDRHKRIFFDTPAVDLWERAKPCLSTPTTKVCYCDAIGRSDFAVCGINALSHYSNLNPESIRMYAVQESVFKNEQLFEGLNAVEGNIKIEVWKYPPVTEKYVDRLSLYLTMKLDSDPRVESELEKMMEGIQW